MTHHVVVVDDMLPRLRLVSTIVAHISGVVVHPFTSSTEALYWAMHNTADAFVLDGSMPDHNALELVGILRADARFALVPLIIVATDTDREVRLTVLAAGANDYMQRPVEPRELISRLQTLLALHDARAQEAERVAVLEAWLRQDERRLRQQTERLTTLWRIANNAELSEDELMQEILDQSTAALRSGQFFTSSLSRLDGDGVVIEARSYDPEVYETNQSVPIGSRIPLDDTIQKVALQAGTTRSWIDVTTDPVASRIARVVSLRCRAVICTPFTVDRQTYFLTYWSREPVGESFGTDDNTYIELVAKFFAARLRESWQTDRVDYHLSHDALTRLGNRTQFRIDARTAYNSAHSGVLAIGDIIGFSDVNESYGHIIGDAILVQAGAALERRVIEARLDGVIAARLAGDRFGIFFPGVASRKDALAAVGPFTEALNGSFPTGDREGAETIPLAARFGVAWSDDPETEVDELMTHAETALYAAKRHATARIEVFTPGMETEASDRIRLIGEISEALNRNEFELYYQPHIDLVSQDVTGAEALIRWHHPTRGTLMPDAFIPFAERNGMIGAISSWVIDNAIEVSRTFNAASPDFRLYLNLSALDLADLNVVERFQRASEAGVSLANLGVEITESAAMQDVGVTTQIVKLLRALDVAVAIDEFGAGYSSVVLLKRLPVDIIKIDHAFVREIQTNLDDAAITETVIGITRRLGSATLGEGVETAEQETWLREHGCRYAQGYHIARPLPLNEFLVWLHGHVRGNVAPEKAKAAS